MARIKRSPVARSRRTLAGLGTAGIVAGTIAVTAGLTAPAANAATVSLKYHCSATVFGADLDQGVWTATVTVGLPTTVNIGDAIPAPKVTAKVTTSAASADTMRGLGVKSIDGTSDATYRFGNQNATAKLTIPSTTVPSSGPIVTTASGDGAAATAPSAPGDVPVTIGDFSGTLNAHTSTDPTVPALGLGLTCTLVPGQHTQVGVIHVVDPNAPTSTPTSPTSTPTTTGTATATATGTGTATSTATGTTTSTGVSGPPIITDGGSSGGGLNGSVLGGAAVAAAGVGALGFGLRRRLSDK